MILICSRHHHAVHEGGWRLTGTAVDLRWHDRHGHRYERPPATATIRGWADGPPMLDTSTSDPPPF